MSTDLDRALANIADQLDDMAPTITVDEILNSADDARSPNLVRLSPTARQRPRRFALVAAAAAVAVAVGGLIAVATLRDPSPSVSEQPAMSTPPQPADLPATGVMISPQDALVVSLATNTLLAECMADQGFEYPQPTTDELVAAFGEWQPHNVLGIQRAGAARRIGYHSSGVGGLGTASQANHVQLMDAAMRDQYFAALEGPELAAATNPNQVATSSDGRIETGGCTAAAQETLGNPLDQDEQLRDNVNAAAGLLDFSASGSGFDDDALDDPRVATALAAWSMCVEDRTGEQADSPNELARRFLDGNYDGSATDPERDVAAADAECQQQAQLWTTWYTVVTELTRTQLASDASLYDQWTRHRVDMVDNARTILSDRGIEPPQLD